MPRALSTALKALFLVLFLPFAALAALASALFGVKEKRSADEVAECLRKFVEAEGGPWDWDDFTSLPIADRELEAIRRRAAAVDLPPGEDGLAVLRRLLAEAEQIAEVRRLSVPRSRAP